MPFEPASSYQICGFAEDINTAWQHKLFALGILPGTIITIERTAPLGDPIQIRIDRTSLLLRSKDLNQFVLEKI